MASADLAAIDLNLPALFEAFLIERSASRAARPLGLAQPSVSNALNHPHVLFGDDLFMRTPQEMRPAPRAQELLVPIISALQHVRAALKPATASEPVAA
jgi:DNA-binding transcriptional LysR family regulator